MTDKGDRPIVGGLAPAVVELKEGEYYAWCTCGRTCTPPFCDGAHRGTDFEPLIFRASASGPAALCRCKVTANPPYCDGAHARLRDVKPGEPVPETFCRGDEEMPDAWPVAEEPTLRQVRTLARAALGDLGGQHGEPASMGVPRPRLPDWDDIVLLPAQLARRPLAHDAPVKTRAIIGPRAKRPLELEIPLLIADMSLGALSPEAKVALARGAARAGAGTCSGEGGMMEEERAENARYLFELGTAMFGWRADVPEKVAAFHFKIGQAAKAGLGGFLPGSKVRGRIARARGLKPGTPAVSPAAFEKLRAPEDFARFAEEVRARSGGIPVGFKIAAGHVERDIDFALQAGADYIMLDGRGGGTGSAPRLLRDHICLPAIAALARARRHLDARAGREVSLIISGGLRTPADFIKALALGADAVAIGTAALQALGCVSARICHTNNCPAGIATQDPRLRARLNVDAGAERVARFLSNSAELMRMFARACGHADVHDFSRDDLATWKPDLAALAGVPHAGGDDTAS